MKNLKTKRLILKPVTLDHVSDYQKYFNNYNVIKTLSDQVPWPFPDDGVEGFLKDVILPVQGKNRWLFGIFLKTNQKELIGAVDLWRDGKPEHRGFWLSESHWGSGLMTEASNRIVDYAFEELGFEKLVFSNALGNEASRRIKEKAGCKFLHLKDSGFVDPKLTQSEIWELTKKEWALKKL